LLFGKFGFFFKYLLPGEILNDTVLIDWFKTSEYPDKLLLRERKSLTSPSETKWQKVRQSWKKQKANLLSWSNNFITLKKGKIVDWRHPLVPGQQDLFCAEFPLALLPSNVLCPKPLQHLDNSLESEVQGHSFAQYILMHEQHWFEPLKIQRENNKKCAHKIFIYTLKFSNFSINGSKALIMLSLWPENTNIRWWNLWKQLNDLFSPVVSDA